MPNTKYRRKVYTHTLNVPVTQSMKDMIKALALIKDIKMSAVVRGILKKALPSVITNLPEDERNTFYKVLKSVQAAGNIQALIEMDSELPPEPLEKGEIHEPAINEPATG